ncbi:MAG: GGDEF domain-containing protein [Synergistetes bacterium]|nr:GGDEF domain-containing protein [Synergistota bacterium]
MVKKTKDIDELRRNIYEKAVAIAFVIYAVLIPINFYMDVGKWHEPVLIASTVTVGIVYVLRKTRDVYVPVALFATVLSSLTAFWFTNGGYKGSIPFYFGMPILLAILFWKGWRRFILVILTLADGLILATVNFYYPYLIHHYTSEFDRYVDVTMGIITSFIPSILGMIYIIDSFDKEHEIVLKQNRELSARAVTDDLTGLCSRAYLFSRLKEAVNRSQRYGTPLSIIMFDVDHFKEINDRCGHQAGDEALRRVASILRGGVRRSDVVGRYGGEEFVVILENTGMDSARIVAEKLRLAIYNVDIMAGCAKVTVSAGVAEYRGESLSEFFMKADKALYKAKAQGRNRVEVAA